ncbi:DUF192 domain-containing protein [Haloplanus sp.]|uniref:DUF192 domain-containing protein n=1 Tax=Haloplanus sp. TaxID=1961696 RepID=UPI0026394EEB|nr:DUF192 domain-containing protein [Haloplanus sp.]
MARVVHRHDSNRCVLAADAAVADSVLGKARGLMFRRSFPGDGLVFPFGGGGTRTLHMVCVTFDIDAVWVLDCRVERVARLPAWTGLGRASADTVIELPAGTADAVTAGDEIRVERS